MSSTETPADLVDLLIVGGGINGTGIARDAAGRGLKAIVVERSDLASATSSASTKLIHGGLRYLEYYEFRLVREALSEREVLLAAAPHIIRPLRFVLPHDKSLRPAWMIRIGLFLYDHLGGRKLLPASKRVSLTRLPYSAGLKPGLHEIGFEYSDCWVNDARMVVLNAMDARERGAEILTRTDCISARREGGLWVAELRGADGVARTVRARALVNAAGPWAGEFVSRKLGRNEAATLRLVKGSHIIIDRLYEGNHAFILQNADRRIVFTIPYEGRFTLVGTTDIPYEGDPAKTAISGDETQYLCDIVTRYFSRAITPADVVWTYSGVRPLFDDHGGESASAVSRDYVLELEDEGGKAPLLNVFGGKITTFRRLSEHALQKLKPFFPEARGDWTKVAHLPGGDIARTDFEAFATEQGRRYPWLTQAHVRRLCRAYGTRIGQVLGDAHAVEDLGRHFGADLYEIEVDYLKDQEWARTAEDVLWRRSKLGLHMTAAERAALEAVMPTANPRVAAVSDRRRAV